ncbi:hypothetical protein TWF281_004846 [Arthrobotrys megalospora]
MNTLPTELVVQVFKHLPPYEVLTTFRPLCRRFSNASDILYPDGRLYGLPICIWERICHFSGYIPLLRLSTTSVSFHRLIHTSETPGLSRVMFHEALPSIPVPVEVTETDDPTQPTHSTTPTASKIAWELHPYFSGLRYTFNRDFFYFMRSESDYWNLRDITKTTRLPPYENATTPPARSITITAPHTHEYPPLQPVRPIRVPAIEGSGRGVTVLQVLVALRRMSVMPMDARQVLGSHRRMCQKSGEVDLGIEPWAAWLKRSSGLSDAEFEEAPGIIEYDNEDVVAEDVWTSTAFPPQREIMFGSRIGWLVLPSSGWWVGSGYTPGSNDILIDPSQ